MTRRAAVLCFGLLCANLAHAAPDMLVVQVRAKSDSDAAPLVLAPYVAEELDRDGRVRPVLWSLTDPVFREWSNRDVMGPYVAQPTAEQALDQARRLGLTYVLTVLAEQRPQGFLPVAELFVRGRSKWRFGPRDPNRTADAVVSTDGRYDEKATRQLQAQLPGLLGSGGLFTVNIGGAPDWDATARSVARTWTLLLGQGPLSALANRPRIDPAPDPKGGTEKLPDMSAAQDPDVGAQAKALAEKGHIARALTLLREACDIRPLDIGLRLDLANALLNAGLPQEAAGTARAAGSLPGSDHLPWLVCAESWAAAGRADFAEQALAEARRRGATGPEVDRVNADISFLRGEAQQAAVYYGPLHDRDAVLRLAVVRAVLGDPEGCLQALKGLPDGDLNLREYSAVTAFLDGAMGRLAAQAQSVVPMARLHPGEAPTLALAHQVEAASHGIASLLEAVRAPENHRASHEARKLAHILLAQASLEALHFAESNDPDLAEESLASLGQALRMLAAVKGQYEVEQRFGS